MKTLNRFAKAHGGTWVGAVAAALLVGCVTEPPSAELLFGHAVRNAVLTQTLVPDTARVAATPLSSEGAIAKSAMDRYRTSYEVPPPPVNVMNIGLGGVNVGNVR